MKRLVVLSLLLVAPLTAAEPYKRPKWADADHDGLDTRAEVLTARCRLATLQERHVQQAICTDAYTGNEIGTDQAPQAIQIDHVLPAVRAWRSRSWAKAEFAEFFNDPANLLITRSRTNARKSDLLPHQWCPADGTIRPAIAEAYILTALRYGIELGVDERRGLSFWARRGCAPGARVLGK